MILKNFDKENMKKVADSVEKALLHNTKTKEIKKTKILIFNTVEEFI